MLKHTNIFTYDTPGKYGSNVYSCFMDMRKASDMVKHSILFKKLMDRKLSPIFMRLMLVMYISQKANVRWGTSYSTSFSITNGVKQGAVLLAVLFCVYIVGSIIVTLELLYTLMT